MTLPSPSSSWSWARSSVEVALLEPGPAGAVAVVLIARLRTCGRRGPSRRPRRCPCPTRVGSSRLLHHRATDETGTGMNLSMTPPCWVARVGLAWRLATLTPSRMTLSSRGKARTTSALLALVLAGAHDHLVTLVDPHHNTSGASDTMRMNRLSRSSRPDRAEDAGAARLLLVVDQHGRVLVEADVAAVGPALLLLGAHDHALDDVALLHGGAGDGVLDRGHEDVADAGVAAARAPEHPDAQHLMGPGVVGHPEAGLLLDHRARSMTSVSRQRLSFDSGRVSFTRTRSPTLAVSLGVVDVELLGALHRLAVAGVADPLDDGHHHGRLHGVGHDDTLTHLAPVRARAVCIFDRCGRPPGRCRRRGDAAGEASASAVGRCGRRRRSASAGSVTSSVVSSVSSAIRPLPLSSSSSSIRRRHRRRCHRASWSWSDRPSAASASAAAAGRGPLGDLGVLGGQLGQRLGVAARSVRRRRLRLRGSRGRAARSGCGPRRGAPARRAPGCPAGRWPAGTAG